jgi:hypothetical protein
MKRKILILFSILSIGFSSISGQESESFKTWSISVSYSPKFEIPTGVTQSKDKYFLGFEFNADRRLSKHFSVQFGVNYLSLNKTDQMQGIPSIKFMSNYSFLEFPLQINYHFLNKSNIFDPYVKTSLINSYYHSVVGVEIIELDTFKEDKYCLFGDIGIGTTVKINNKLSLIGQTSLGFGIKYINPQYYFKGLIGIRYSLLKKASS